MSARDHHAFTDRPDPRIISVTLPDGSQVMKKTRNANPVALVGVYRNKPAEIVSLHPDADEATAAMNRCEDRRWRNLLVLPVDPD